MAARSAHKPLGVLLVAAHLVLLVIAALPSSRFKEALGSAAVVYVSATGQIQDWAMYQRPDRNRAEYELVATFPDGHEEHPWGTMTAMDARRLYMLEGVLLVGDGRAVGERLLDVIHARSEEGAAPSRLRLRRTTFRLRDFRDVPGASVLGPLKGRDRIARTF